jgi:hypothetical protein
MKSCAQSVARWLAALAIAGTLASGCSKKIDNGPSDEEVLRLKSQCKEAGEKARNTWTSQYANESFSGSPEYGYSASLKTCLYADEYTDVDDGRSVARALLQTKSRRDRFVLDVYSNKVLCEYTEHDGVSITTEPDSVMCRTEAEFEARKAKLFASPTTH